MRRVPGCTTTLALAALLTAWALPAWAGPGEDREALQAELARQAPELRPEVLGLALRAEARARAEGRGAKRILAVIDYSRPSTTRRLWIFDLGRRRLLFHELVAHGKGSGENLATRFSNRGRSLASSLGLFEAGATYQGKHGLSLKLLGLEPGFNDRAERRAIVIHGADYVSREFARVHGRLGRSWGCPAVRPEVARALIEALANGGLVFVYYPDERWLARSRYL
ncbi:MAG TPA: murein L,D-transpeptidase catalytic domain family protein [Myxococcota bacterium]|nr:murein L,D-transpeptidase catalytic domain family protein [Myxococcota bacterium]HRY92196.1 murein L,D-transpeptidase catalytic domain family protein [Myxococcota bacterium]HSA21869.1 murein L,D-transpeptidase catalytic domain family protein [Myxococcota bacterium]